MITVNNSSIYQNPIPNPVYYKNDTLQLQKFEELDKNIQNNFHHLLQYVTLEADLEKTPTLRFRSINNNKISILNYTNLSSTEIIKYLTNQNHVISKVFLGLKNYFMVTYRSLLNSQISCIEVKGENEPLAKERLFIKTTINHFSYLLDRNDVSEKSICLSQISFQIADQLICLERQKHSDINL